MTGFGKIHCISEEYSVVAEIKSINSKHLDLQIKLDENLKYLEMPIRKLITEKIERGRIELCMVGEKNAIQNRLAQTELIDNFIHAIKTIEARNGIPHSDYIQLFLQNAGTQMTNIDAEIEKMIMHSIGKLLIQWEQSTHEEGMSIEKEIQKSLQKIENCIQTIEKYETERREKLEKNLKEKIENTIGEAKNESRFAEEMCYLLERLDISEEKMRLVQHREYFEKTLFEPSNGKKLQFIAQEMLREMNTLGAKANHAPLQHVIVEMKNELEKIKEQLSNVY